MKTEYLSSDQVARLKADRVEVLSSPEGATHRFMRDGRLTFARIPIEDVSRALFRQRQSLSTETLAGGNA